jgi:hypothetical protein
MPEDFNDLGLVGIDYLFKSNLLVVSFTDGGLAFIHLKDDNISIRASW